MKYTVLFSRYKFLLDFVYVFHPCFKKPFFVRINNYCCSYLITEPKTACSCYPYIVAEMLVNHPAFQLDKNLFSADVRTTFSVRSFVAAHKNVLLIG